MKNFKIILFAAIIGLFSSCQKDDPFVDRVVSPVLVVFEDFNGTFTSGLTTEPSVSSSSTADAKLTLFLYSLDKEGILDYKMGIKKIPASDITVTYKLRSTGASIGTSKTNAEGKAILSIPWKSLGLSTIKAGSSVALTCTATYNKQTFSKYVILNAN